MVVKSRDPCGQSHGSRASGGHFNHRLIKPAAGIVVSTALILHTFDTLPPAQPRETRCSLRRGSPAIKRRADNRRS
jgi:hypothetical protein